MKKTPVEPEMNEKDFVDALNVLITESPLLEPAGVFFKKKRCYFTVQLNGCRLVPFWIN